MPGTAPAIVDVASTGGWDTVFASHIADVNAAIIKAGTSPTSFSATDKEDGLSAVGTFGPWQIVPGGDGELIWLRIPFKDTVVTTAEGPQPPLNGAAVVEVRLDFLHQDMALAPDARKTFELRLRTQGEAIAQVQQMGYDGAQPVFLIGIALREMLEQWLNDNLVDFDHVFATVDLNRTADVGAFQWLQATDVAYAYADLTTKGDGALGVLCMTEGRAATGLVAQLSPNCIPAGQRAGFLIAKNRLLKKLLLPCMPHMFAGASPTDFALSPSGESIINVTEDVAFTVTEDGKDYTANIISFTLDIEGEELRMAATTRTTISAGIHAFCETQSFLGIQLITKPDNTQTLSFNDTRPAITNHWTEQSSDISLAEKVLGIIALVAAVAAVLTGGAAIGVAALVIGLVAGIMTVTTTMLEAVHKNDAPAITAMLLDSTAPINWGDTTDFVLTSASLNDSLQLGGYLTAVSK